MHCSSDSVAKSLPSIGCDGVEMEQRKTLLSTAPSTRLANDDMPALAPAPALGRVLVVDDAASNRKIVCKILTKRGYECFQAEDGRQCVDMVLSHENFQYFDCILMDSEMPVLNGPDATADLRRRGYKQPIYGLTGNVMDTDIDFFLRCGADHIMSKPFQILEFSSLLAKSKCVK
jgi:CheY-like chemotaxis protein